MNKFNLDNFKIEKSDSTKKETQYPSWHKDLSENGKLIYEEITKSKIQISKKIKQGCKLSKNERLIVPSQIATRLGLHRSSIQKRRHPKLVQLIKKQNRRLEKLWEIEGKKSKYPLKTKTQLTKEITNLKKQLKEEKDRNYSEVLTSFLNSELNQKQARLAAKISELEAENRVLKNKIANIKIRSI